MKTSLIRHLGDFEEVVGTLKAIDTQESFLLLTVDSAQYSVDLNSEDEVESVRQQVAPYVGKQVTILRDAHSSRSLRIREVTLRSENVRGEQ
jgi:hypothetical protein